MNNNVKVSVITPTHNDEKYIRTTMKSVLNQTHSNLELILIDDFSNDKTVEIIKAFDDKRIKLFVNSSNMGAAFCRNLGLSQSTGDYIAFCDGDDFWDETKLERQLHFMLKNNYAFTYTEYHIVNEQGKKTSKFVTGPKTITHKTFLKMDYVGCLTVMYKKQLFPNLQIPNDILKRNDYALWLKLSEKESCHLLKEKLAFYRKRDNSVSSGSKFKLIRFHKELFKKLYNFSRLKSALYAYRNACYYLLKRMRYIKKDEA